MTGSRRSSDRAASLLRRVTDGKPSRVEIRLAATKGMRRGVKRQLRRAVEKHEFDTGVILLGQFPLLTLADGGHTNTSLWVRVGRQRLVEHISWLLRTSTRAKITWRSKQTSITASPAFGLRPLGPKWIPISPEYTHVLAIGLWYKRSFESTTVDIQLREGDKKLIFLDGTDRSRRPRFSVRDI